MKTTKNKILAVILSAVAAVSACSALPASANASSFTPTAQTASVPDAMDISEFFGRRLDFDKMTDPEGETVNPFRIFGSSFMDAHEMYFNEDGTFAVYLGAYKENQFCGTYSCDKASERFELRYADGFNALAPIGSDLCGTAFVNVPVSINGTVYVVRFRI